MTCGAWSWWPRDLLSRGERRSRELEVMRHLHGDGDDVHVSAVHKVLGVIDRERHAEAPAGGLGGFAPVVNSAVISKSSGSDCRAGMCACFAHPRSGLAPMMPTRILLVMMPC